MDNRLKNFIDFANRIVEADQEISKLTSDDEVDRLTSNRIDIEEISKTDLHDLLNFSKSRNAEKVAFLFIVLMNVIRNEVCFQRFAEFAYINREEFHIYTQYFLYAQIVDMANRDKYTLPLYYSDWILEISRWYSDYFTEELKPIEYKNREKGLVLVVTSQFLGILHSATKLTCDICRGILISGRRLLLINLADALSLTGHLPYWNQQSNYVEKYSSVSNMYYEDVQIPFAQCDRGLPNINMMKELILELREMRPEVIVSIGEDIFSNVINDMIPVCSIPLQAKLSRNFTKYLVHYNEITADEMSWMKKYFYSDENIVPLKLPFRIEYSDGITRSDMGIPTDSFCLVVIGNRLEIELTDDFLQTIENIIAKTNAIFLTIGHLDCESKYLKYPHISNNSIHLEYTQKLLAVCSITDLYINPPREGGGTSAIYAMAAGKPVVTLNFGDVYKNCGFEFSVENLQELGNQTLRYIEDKEFYYRMTDLAIKRAKEFEKVEDNINELLSELEKREKGNYFS